MSPRPKLTEQHPNLDQAIKDTAWRQIAEFGAPALSLRAIARELGITAPAIYNYFADRDALVTALIVDAFNSLGDAERNSITDLPAEDYAARFATLGRAYRQWALTYPERYNLIFGTPIVGYEAPAEITTPAAAYSLEPLINTLEAARAAGRLRVPNEYGTLSPELQSQFTEWCAIHSNADVHVLHFSLVIWSLVHGLVALEIFGQFPPMILNTDELFEIEMQALLNKFML